ncbi:MAG: pyridoxamine kinase [Halanaerobiales bacterium]
MNTPIKKVAAIHDISGFGRASLTVIIPILSRMGIQVCPLPTAVLSTHSKFKNFHFVDLTNEIEPIISHWKSLNLKFNAIYSGFLGSYHQMEIVSKLIEEFKSEETMVVIDPVLGDDGKLYSTFNMEHVKEMKKFISKADIITPNLTEAAFLLDKDIPQTISKEEIKKWIIKLSQKGPQIVIITSVPETDIFTSVLAYDKKDGRFWKVRVNYIPAIFPGTGDAFASVITGSILQGDSLPLALDRAARFTSMGVKSTYGYEYDSNEGILLEKILDSLEAPLQTLSYEIF